MATFEDEIEDPADTYNDAVGEGDRFMLLAAHAYAASESVDVIDATALQVARANYFQTRALAFYQFAALIKDQH